MGRRQWHAVVEEVLDEEGLPWRTRALNLEVPMEMRKRIAKARKLNEKKKNAENADQLKAFARKNDENDKRDKHPPHQVPRRPGPGGARSHTSKDDENIVNPRWEVPDRDRCEENAAVIAGFRNWHRGWWERDHESRSAWTRWVYRVPCVCVDYYLSLIHI